MQAEQKYDCALVCDFILLFVIFMYTLGFFSFSVDM